ncbi:putative carbohydrate kinase-related domain protein [Paratrimastix pyriformis]|uniref:ATP-dependent (S)-NAD(P)H-hydrate dehydratase n=1 Tax=Paratrimastix pyriformis TaxID=342808 RepID=A0ABQ8UXQ4_9EUKA|nr:putative carbohydrate kinase-related domain protein [Paratrimastix pyriformis]
MSALRLGCDLSHVFCAKQAGIPIKCYSPDLIVHPYFEEGDPSAHQATIEKMRSWLPRLTSLVVGPGLGQDPEMWALAADIVALAREQQLPIILDGDAISLVCRRPELVRGYPRAVLTPNFNEFKRLISHLVAEAEVAQGADPLLLLYRALGGPTIIQKGAEDRIVDGDGVVTVALEGSPRRCGGQGDLLAGTLGVFTHWVPTVQGDHPDRPMLRAAQCAALVTRTCSRLAFARSGRAMTAQEMVALVPEALTACEGLALGGGC